MDSPPCDLVERFFPSLSKFVPHPRAPPEPYPPNSGDQPAVPKPDSSRSPVDPAEFSDENLPPRRSNSEPPATSAMQVSKRRGDESPRSDTMSPARKAGRFASPSPAHNGGSVIRKNPIDLGSLTVAPNEDPAIDEYFRFVAKRGRTLFDWDIIREAFLWKLEAVCQEVWRLCPYDESPSDSSNRVPSTGNPSGNCYIQKILETASTFNGIPFTIQRLCELITDPLRQYKRADKLFRAIEKNLRIVSTVGKNGERVTRKKSPSTGSDSHSDHSMHPEEPRETDLPQNISSETSSTANSFVNKTASAENNTVSTPGNTAISGNLQSQLDLRGPLMRTDHPATLNEPDDAQMPEEEELRENSTELTHVPSNSEEKQGKQDEAEEEDVNMSLEIEDDLTENDDASENDEKSTNSVKISEKSAENSEKSEKSAECSETSLNSIEISENLAKIDENSAGNPDDEIDKTSSILTERGEKSGGQSSKDTTTGVSSEIVEQIVIEPSALPVESNNDGNSEAGVDNKGDIANKVGQEDLDGNSSQTLVADQAEEANVELMSEEKEESGQQAENDKCATAENVIPEKEKN